MILILSTKERSIMSVSCYFIVLLLLSFSSVFSLETVKLPSSARLEECFIRKGFHHFAETTHFIRDYAEKELYPSGINLVMQMHINEYKYVHGPESKMVVLLQEHKDELIDCTLQDVKEEEEDLKRIRLDIKEGKCQ